MMCEKCKIGYSSTKYWASLNRFLCPSCGMEELTKQDLGGLTHKQYYEGMLKLMKKNRKEFYKNMKIVREAAERRKERYEKMPKCPTCNGRMVVVCEKTYKNAMNALARSGYSQKKMIKTFGWKVKK